MRLRNIGYGHVRNAQRAFLMAGCLALASPLSLAARQVSHCAEAARFLEEDRGMTVVTEPDTIDDWRTAKKQPGCKVTAAGLTEIGVAAEAVRFYERVRQAGWTRTPDPRDSPGEASLRFRKRDSDCLFNVYEGTLLMTEAERQVSAATVPIAGRSRYRVFVMCMAALPRTHDLGPGRPVGARSSSTRRYPSVSVPPSDRGKAPTAPVDDKSAPLRVRPLRSAVPDYGTR